MGNYTSVVSDVTGKDKDDLIEIVDKDTLHNFLRSASSTKRIEELIWRHLGSGYSIDQLDGNGKTPLMAAIENDSCYSILYIKMLLEHKPNLNIRGKRQIISGHSYRTTVTTALHLALYHMREPEVIKLLINAGADVYWIDDERRNALLVGAAVGVSALVLEIILEQPQDVDRADIYGKSAIHLLCEGNCPDCKEQIEVLIKYGADIGKTHMDVALKNGNLKAAAVLMKAGVEI